MGFYISSSSEYNRIIESASKTDQLDIEEVRKEDNIMLMQVLGKQQLDFSTKDGQVIKGTNLFVAYKNENTEGLKADKIFVREGIVLPKDMTINSKVEISFDNRGKIEEINLK